jgi:hypothetical protein
MICIEPKREKHDPISYGKIRLKENKKNQT